MKDSYYDVDHWASVHLMDLTWSPLGGWMISGVEVNKQFRGQGHAKRLLQQVLDDADAEGLPLYLAAASDGTGLSQEDLCAFYESLGFEQYAPTDDPNAFWRPACQPSARPLSSSPSCIERTNPSTTSTMPCESPTTVTPSG